MLIVLAFLVGLGLGALCLWLWGRGEVARRDERLALVGRSEEQWHEHLKALTGETLGQAAGSLEDIFLQLIQEEKAG